MAKTRRGMSGVCLHACWDVVVASQQLMMSLLEDVSDHVLLPNHSGAKMGLPENDVPLSMEHLMKQCMT